MKNYKYFRVLVCLLLVCALIISISPIKAKAVGVDWILRQIATDIGVTGILEGLGLFRDTLNGDEYYNNLVSDVKDHLANTGQITGDYIDAYWRIDSLNANPVLTIPLALISAVRNYVFNNGVVSYKPVVSGTSYEYTVGSQSGTCTTSAPTSLLVAYTEYRSGYECKLFAYSKENENFLAYNNGSTSFINSFQYGDYWVAQVMTFTTSSMSPSTLPLYHVASRDDYYSIFYSPIKSGVYSDNPVTLGVISPPDTLFNVAYPQWLEHQRELEDGTTETVVQIGLGNTQAETESLTQEQIWTGQGTLTVPDEGQVSESVLLPGWLQQGIENLRLGLQDILSTLISLPVSIAEALAKVFIPSKDYISAKVEAIRGEFGFIDSVIATGEFIRDSISGDSGPPVIYVDLGRAPSGNYGSQRVLLTDFSWYAPYKGQVDTVLSSALWAFFGWRVFLKLPGIIGGESGYISDVFFSGSSGRSGSDDKKKGGKG